MGAHLKFPQTKSPLSWCSGVPQQTRFSQGAVPATHLRATKSTGHAETLT